MQRDFRPLEDGEQFGLIGVQPRQQAIECGKTSAATEDAIEAGAHLSAASDCRSGAIGLQIGIEPCCVAVRSGAVTAASGSTLLRPSAGRHGRAPMPNPLRTALACRSKRRDPSHPPRTVRIAADNQSHSRRAKRNLPQRQDVLRLSRTRTASATGRYNPVPSAGACGRHRGAAALPQWPASAAARAPPAP
jgi:hypothetical protein